jgi:hypothetical protein
MRFDKITLVPGVVLNVRNSPGASNSQKATKNPLFSTDVPAVPEILQLLQEARSTGDEDPQRLVKPRRSES